MPDFSDICTVLCAHGTLWHDVLEPGISKASLPGGRSIRPLRVDPDDDVAMRSAAVLDAIEYGPLLVVDLVDIDPRVFPFVEWFARARPHSVLLFRRGQVALPIELHSFLVRSMDATDEASRSHTRVMLGTLATHGASDAYPRAGRGSLHRHVARIAQRRERNGVAVALRDAARSVLDGNLTAARRAMTRACTLERKAVDLLLRSAVLDRKAGRWREAGDLLEIAVRRVPDNAAAWRELGIVREHVGDEGAEDALRHAVKLSGDYEATVSLASRLMRKGEARQSVQLLDHAMRVSDGQLNLILPALEARARAEGRIRFREHEQRRLETVLEIRRSQADADPPVDAPWSHFDVARAHLALNDVDAAEAICVRAQKLLSAPWQTETFGQSLEAYEAAGREVSKLRAALRLDRRHETSESPTSAPTTPYHADARAPDWFVRNVPCMEACPVGTDAGAYVRMIAERRFEEAFHVARAPNPLASVCGRICAAPCEDACRRGALDEPVQIRALKRFVTERHGVEGVTPMVDSVLAAGDAPCVQGRPTSTACVPWATATVAAWR